MDKQGKRVVIVGGGFGGLSTAKKLRNSDFDVTLIDSSNHHLFQPLLYQVATAALSPGDIAVPIRSIVGGKGQIEVLLGEVTDINRENRILELKNGQPIPYDYLVLAPGARYNYFGNDEWKNHAPGLKSISDALQIRERILLSLEKAEQIDDPERRRDYLTYVIIGGGPTGVEMAGAIAEIAKYTMMRDFNNFKRDESRIVLLEATSRILNGYPGSLSDRAQKDLENMGVEVMLNTPVTNIIEDRVSFENGTITTPNIIWAAGVAASPLLNALGAEQDRSGRVIVNKSLALPDDPHIFVIGDAAHFKTESGDPLPALAPVAIQQGRYVARILKKNQSPEERKPFKYIDKGTMATIGRAKAVADIKGMKFSGLIAWLIWSFVHILYLIGFRNRIRVFAEWVWYYFTFRRGVRLITERYSR